MMSRNFNIYSFLLLICCLFFCLKASAQDIQANAKLEQTAIRIGDQTKLQLSVFQQLKEKVNFPVIGDTLTSAIQVLSSSKLDTVRDKNDPNKIVVTKSLVITSFDAGNHTIPALIFETTSGNLKSNVLRLMVQSVKVDTTKNIYDIKEPLAVSYTFSDWLKDNWQPVLLSMLGAILIVLLLYYWNRRRKTNISVLPQQPFIPPHKIALEKLNVLKDKKLWQQDRVKEYFSELTDVLRDYIEKRYRIKTQERTTDEIISSLMTVEMAADNKEMLHQVLLLADLVKFAKGKPSATENEKSIIDAMLFVSSTAERQSEGLNDGNGNNYPAGSNPDNIKRQ